MKINISHLQDGEHNYNFQIKGSDFEISDAELIDDVKVDVQLYKSSNQISLNVSVNGKFKFTCDRCLEPYSFDFENEFALIYKFDHGFEKNSFEKGELNSRDDNLKFISSHTNEIDISDDVRDYIILSIPMRKVPKDENGICTYCKRNIEEIISTKKEKEINPLWEKLLNIKKN